MMSLMKSLMVFRNRMSRFHPINSTKNIREISSIIAANTSTNHAVLVTTVEDAVLANSNEVERGSSVSSIYLSVFAISEGGELATEVPLVDWYIIKDQGARMRAAGFVADGFPTPGNTGVHENKRFILHTEKGLSGGGDASLAGVPMIFKGVIRIPKGMRQMKSGDEISVNFRTSFATKVCSQAIYKWYK